MEYPTLLDDAPPELYVYSICSTGSEKMEAIVSLGVANSRYKDFDGNILQEALTETFGNRHTGFDQIAAFDPGFTDNYNRQQRWRGFLKNKNVASARSFSDVVEEVKIFMLPVIEAIRSGQEYSYKWNPMEGRWNKK